MADITLEKNGEGALVLSAFVDDGAGPYLLTRRYYDYTRGEALALFRAEIREIEAPARELAARVRAATRWGN